MWPENVLCMNESVHGLSSIAKDIFPSFLYLHTFYFKYLCFECTNNRLKFHHYLTMTISSRVIFYSKDYQWIYCYIHSKWNIRKIISKLALKLHNDIVYCTGIKQKLYFIIIFWILFTYQTTRMKFAEKIL